MEQEGGMTLKLVCPECGFRFVVAVPDDISEDELREVKECPCGAQMEERDDIPPINVI